MRCRPGDLAVYKGQLAEHYGKFLRCTEFKAGPRGQPAWLVEPSLRGKTYSGKWVEDRVLYPIRDPGDDAVDQTLIWKPVPAKETA